MKAYQLMGNAPYFTNCFMLTDNLGNAVVIDCSMDIEKVKAILENDGCNLNAVLLTHGHHDHRETIQDFINEFPNTTFYLGKEDALLFGITGTIEYPTKLTFGEIKIKVFHTPGHTPGGVCLLNDGMLFSGDTLFAGTVGRTDLEGGDFDVLEQSLEYLLNAITDDNVTVLPGHNHFSAFGQEKQQNPYLKKILKEL